MPMTMTMAAHTSWSSYMECDGDGQIGWECTTLFEGHTHYVMQVEFNPKDSNTFASASLDRTVKVWGLNASTPHFSLEGHERGVNCVGYFRGGDRPYLVSGADDQYVLDISSSKRFPFYLQRVCW
jgi:WD40 repeat protein